MLSLVATGALVAASWAAGTWPAIAWRPCTALERTVVRFGIGLIVLAAAHGALCLWSTRAAAGAVIALGAAGVGAAVRKPALNLPPLGTIERRSLAAMLALVIIAGLPPITAGDSFIYHLPTVTHTLAAHQLRFWPEVWRSTFPQSHEMLAVFVGELGGNRFGWIAGGELLLLWGALLAIGRRAIGAGGWLVPVIVSGGMCPIVLLGDPLKPDLLVLLALALGILAVASQNERPPGVTAILVGLAAGGCIGAKYSAIPAAAMLVMAAAVESRRPTDLAIACAVGLMTGGFWYARNLMIHGTPVPPFFAAPFLSNSARESVRAAMRSFGLGRSLGDLIASPMMMFLAPRRFGGTGGLFSPLVYLGIGALFIRAERRLALRAVGGFIALYIAWFFSLQNPRLLLPAVLPLAVLAAVVIERVRAASPVLVSNIAAVAALAALVPGTFAVVLSSARYVRHGETEYLRERSPFYNDIRRIDAELPPGARVLSLVGVLGAGPPRWLAASPYMQAELAPEELVGNDLGETLRRHSVTHVFGTWSSFQGRQWSSARDRMRLVWRNPNSCPCGRHLLRADTTVETALFEIKK